MGDGVDLEEPRLSLDLVTGLADLDGAAQQRTGLGRRLAPQLLGSPHRGEVAVDGRRTHGHQFVSDGWGVARLVVELTARLQQVQQQRHGLLEVLAALPAAGGPHSLEHLQGVVGVPAGSSPALRRLSATRWALGCGHQASARIVPTPASDCTDLIKDPPLVLLRRPRVHPGVLSRDLGPGLHRQPTSHAHHGPRASRAVLHEAPSLLRGHPS